MRVVSAALDQYFERARCRRVVAHADPENQAALRQLLPDSVDVAVRNHARQQPADSRSDRADGARRNDGPGERAAGSNDGETARDPADEHRDAHGRRLAFDPRVPGDKGGQRRDIRRAQKLWQQFTKHAS